MTVTYVGPYARGKQSVCRKTRFASRDEARAALVAMRGDWRNTLVHLDAGGNLPRRAYRCLGCGGWHLTSRPKVMEVIRDE